MTLVLRSVIKLVIECFESYMFRNAIDNFFLLS